MNRKQSALNAAYFRGVRALSELKEWREAVLDCAVEAGTARDLEAHDFFMLWFEAIFAELRARDPVMLSFDLSAARANLITDCQTKRRISE